MTARPVKIFFALLMTLCVSVGCIGQVIKPIDSLLQKANDPSRVPESAILILSEQVAQFENPEDKAMIHDRIAAAYEQTGVLDSAAAHAWQVLRLVPDNMALCSRACQTLGFVAFNKDAFERSRDFYDRSYRLSDELKDVFGMMNAAAYLGRIESRLAHQAEAREHFQQAIELARQRADSAAVNQLTQEMIPVLRGLRDFRQAEDLLNQILQQSKGDAARLAEAHKEYGRLEEAREQPFKALAHYKAALVHNRKQDSDTYLSIAQIYSRTIHLDTATLYADSAESVAKVHHNLPALRDGYQLRYQIAEQRKDTASAFRYFLSYSHYDDTLKQREADRRVQHVRDELILGANEASMRTADLQDQLALTRHTQDVQWTNFFRVLAGVGVLFLVVIFLWIRSHLSTRRKVQEQLEQIRELQSSNEKLFTVMARDLQGPLSTFSNLTRSLGTQMEKATPEERSNLIGHLYSSSIELRQSLNELLDWTLSKSGAMNTRPEVFSCRQLAAGVEEDLRPIAEERSVTVNFLVPDMVMAFADKAMIRIVLRSLLSLAVRGSREGDVITIFSGQKDGLITLGIKDHGSEDLREKLNALQTASPADSGAEGQGLGLALCRDLVRANGGDLYVETIPGEGNTCYLTLPEPR